MSSVSVHNQIAIDRARSRARARVLQSATSVAPVTTHLSSTSAEVRVQQQGVVKMCPEM